ncbi:hypothetical protein [Gluconobacter sp. P5E10]|uniref:hypothetical protein n=1 Tax=Gluconobacter sp. P5E10 TaxID=2762613 RepID=UPI001C054CAF|nr:hypothetical protein [Gluconobacter sp. P5E10]
MDRKDIDFEQIRARLHRFWQAPDELTLGAWLSVLLSGIFSCAYRHVERDMSWVQKTGFSGFHVMGFALWLAIAAFGAACLSRRRASFNVPRLYCDRAAYALALFCLIKTYVFLQSYQTQTQNFFFFFSTFHLYFTPDFGIVFMLAAPCLLWRATRVEKTVLNDMPDDSNPDHLSSQDDETL